MCNIMPAWLLIKPKEPHPAKAMLCLPSPLAATVYTQVGNSSLSRIIYEDILCRDGDLSRLSNVSLDGDLSRLSNVSAL